MVRFRGFGLMVGLGLALAVPAQAQGLFDQLKKNLPATAPGVPDAISGATSDGAGGALSLGDITAGLKEALKVGAQRAIQTTGKPDGYNGDPAIHIPLPPQLRNVQSTLRRFGLSGMADDLELKLNRAAEAAAPKTKQLFVNAITAMTLDDAKAIYNGPEDAATQYFKRTTSDDLKGVIKPVVDQALNQVGAVASYDQLMSRYSSLPFVPDVKANISDHTVGLALQGLFHYVAKEEAAIRQNPAKRTTELLTKVFGR